MHQDGAFGLGLVSGQCKLFGTRRVRTNYRILEFRLGNGVNEGDLVGIDQKSDIRIHFMTRLRETFLNNVRSRWVSRPDIIRWYEHYNQNI
jgi:hypothetical protein